MEEDEIEVIPNGINFLEMEKNIQKKSIEKILHGYGIGEKDPIIGGVFRLETGKRPKLWIRSFIRARKDIPNLKGLIIGGGRLEEEIMKMISSEGLEDSIFLVGESDSVGSWLKKMDIFLLTSSSEGMPNVLIEAQGFGVPVISTDVGGVSEVVLDGETGILVKSDSSEEIGSIVAKLFSHDERFQMGERAKILSRNRNSIHKMIQTTGETYSRLLSVERGNDERDGFEK
jgi:glycosyltransferase involved in cell wall biosynthesis